MSEKRFALLLAVNDKNGLHTGKLSGFELESRPDGETLLKVDCDEPMCAITSGIGGELRIAGEVVKAILYQTRVGNNIWDLAVLDSVNALEALNSLVVASKGEYFAEEGRHDLVEIWDKGQAFELTDLEGEAPEEPEAVKMRRLGVKPLFDLGEGGG